MIIDCHCHVGLGDGLSGPWDTRASIASYLTYAREAGIDRTALFATFHSDYQQANRQVARIVQSRPNRFYGFICVHPQRDRGQIINLVRPMVETFHFCGIKVHQHDARITREICDVANAFGLPVLYDVMGEVSITELLAKEYPHTAFIIPHLGSFADDWRSQRAFIDCLVRHPNIYTDTSGVRRFELLKEAVERAGARKILFGSDGPWLHPGLELMKVRALRLQAADEARVLSRNFLGLISRVTGVPATYIAQNTEQLFVPIADRDPWSNPDPSID